MVCSVLIIKKREKKTFLLYDFGSEFDKNKKFLYVYSVKSAECIAYCKNYLAVIAVLLAFIFAS